MRITSADNPLFRRLRRLADTPRACRESGRTIAEGTRLIESALAAGIGITALVVRGESPAAAEPLLQRIESAGTKRVTLAPALYDAISPVEHGAGVLVEIEIPPSAALGTLRDDAIYLDAVQDPGNVGTMLRTAAAAGVRVVLTGTGTAAPWSPKVMRAAMGAHFALTIYENASLAALKERVTGSVLAADPDGEDLYMATWGAAPTLWLFGSEGQGLSVDARASADLRLRIPIADGVESLNVAAAAAVCLFEQGRRRRHT